MDLVNHFVSLPSSQPIWSLAKHDVTFGALSEPAMSFHGNVISRKVQALHKESCTLSLIPSFVSINCQIGLMVSFNIILLCQSEVQSKVCNHIAVCMSASLVSQCLISQIVEQLNRKGNKDSGSFRE